MKTVDSRKEIFVFGASGHAKVVIDIIEQQGLYDIAFLVDDDTTLKTRTVYGYKVIGGKSELLASGIRLGVVAIGSNKARQSVSRWLLDNGFERITPIHPSAQLARGVTIGEGTVVMSGVVVNSDSIIGDDVIINTHASIDHDCRIGNAVHIAPRATLCGTVCIGENSFICAGATIIPNLTIGCNVTVGAGSTVIRDIPDNQIVAGSPARVLK